jgi:tetratricopeptide (TPR) repeat protein
MKPLEPPDSHHLRAAQGWLGLGNPLEAAAELNNITPALNAHPDVLEVRWHIFASSKQWDACVEIGMALTKLAPDLPEGWLGRSIALHKLKRTKEAFDQLIPTAERHPRVWTIPYNLACYCAQLGQLAEAKGWLEKAFATTASSEDMKCLNRMALEDPDLEPLRKRIKQP